MDRWMIVDRGPNGRTRDVRDLGHRTDTYARGEYNKAVDRLMKLHTRRVESGRPSEFRGRTLQLVTVTVQAEAGIN